MPELHTFLNKVQRRQEAPSLLKELPLLLVTRSKIRMKTHHSSEKILGFTGDKMNYTSKTLKEVAKMYWRDSGK